MFQLVEPGDARGGNSQWNEGGHQRPPKRCSQVDERPKGRAVVMVLSENRVITCLKTQLIKVY